MVKCATSGGTRMNEHAYVDQASTDPAHSNPHQRIILAPSSMRSSALSRTHRRWVSYTGDGCGHWYMLRVGCEGQRLLVKSLKKDQHAIDGQSTGKVKYSKGPQAFTKANL